MHLVLPNTIIKVIGYGGIGVTMFTFLSGVGLWQSLDKKFDLRHFYWKRIKRVLIPYIAFASVFYFILDVVIKENVVLFFKDLTCISFCSDGRWAWYVAWLISIYVFYPLYSRMTHSKSWISLIVATILIGVIAFVGIPSRFNSAVGATLAYLCGDFAGRYVKMNHKSCLLLMLDGVIFAPLYLLGVIEG